MQILYPGVFSIRSKSSNEFRSISLIFTPSLASTSSLVGGVQLLIVKSPLFPSPARRMGWKVFQNAAVSSAWRPAVAADSVALKLELDDNRIGSRFDDLCSSNRTTMSFTPAAAS
jgi:hypothetical protein